MLITMKISAMELDAQPMLFWLRQLIIMLQMLEIREVFFVEMEKPSTCHLTTNRKIKSKRQG